MRTKEQNLGKFDYNLRVKFSEMPKKEHHQLNSLPGGSVVKNPLERPETWVQSLGQEDPPEKEMEIHFSILAWRIL